MHTGGCHCGAIRYALSGDPMHHALCHCADCRMSAGAPMVGWAMLKSDQFRITRGEAKEYASSEHGRRYFCAACGTGLFYRNQALLPDITDVQSATLDDPAAIPPQLHIQTADRIDWMRTAHTLPEFERFPSQE
jgi:hypothetical protein